MKSCPICGRYNDIMCRDLCVHPQANAPQHFVKYIKNGGEIMRLYYEPARMLKFVNEHHRAVLTVGGPGL